MDFFASQDAARVRTRWLVILFLLAVAAIVVCVYVAVTPAFYLSVLEGVSDVTEYGGGRFWDFRRFLAVAVGTVGVIGLGSLYKLLMLREGGAAVARMLGGRPILSNTQHPLERKLLNVVEEMALASGAPVPDVYLMDKELGINAFAAGYSTERAVIGVTRGCVEQLSRDELQGVIAHEFSHILNGDMRLNLKLLGVLNGILLIAIIGRILLRGSVHVGGDREGAAAGIAIAIAGLALFLIGYVGLFFGQLIKAAVSRQREFLADASAVQFTRNPGGISGALKKIGGFVKGSKIFSPRAEEASHMFFGQSGKPWLGFLLATHPPLDERIRRLDPYFVQSMEQEATAAPSSKPLAGAAMGLTGDASAGVSALSPASATARVGTLDTAHLEYARSLMERIPATLKDAVHEPTGAEGLVLALLLHPNPKVRERQAELLHAGTQPAVLQATKVAWDHIQGMPPEMRLPLLDLAIPAIRSVSLGQFQSFFQTVRELITADNELGLFEYVVQTTLSRHLQVAAGKSVTDPGKSVRSLSALQVDCTTLLSALAHAGHSGAAQAEQAFAAAAKELGKFGRSLTLSPAKDAGLRHIDKALSNLLHLSGEAKRSLLQAATACILYDRKVTIAEGELLRAIGESLACPMPPFIPGLEI